LIRERAEEVRARSTVEISSDPKDDPFCLCSEQGKADFIITLNPKDFSRLAEGKNSSSWSLSGVRMSHRNNALGVTSSDISLNYF